MTTSSTKRTSALMQALLSRFVLFVMRLKFDDKGNVVTTGEGDARQPVYVHDDGKELPFDAAGTVARISALNREAQTHREAKEAVELKLKDFAGIEDPAAAIAAVQKIKDLGDAKLVEAGKVEEVRKAAVAAVEERLKAAETAHAQKLNEINSQNATLQAQLHNEIIGGAFGRSKYLSEKVAIPPDMVQAAFAKQFKVEDGKLVAYDSQGSRLYSRLRPGEPVSDFEEAIELVIDQYPRKADILRGTGATGSGTRSSSGVDANGKKTITRSEYERLDPYARATKLKDHDLVEG